MPDTPTPGETATQQEPKNDATPVSTPPEVKADDSAAEKLKKELAQAQMRANQLENEKKAREEAEAKKQAEQLEQQNQFKELYEQEKAKREEFEQERESANKKAELDNAAKEVFADYPDEVRILAEEAGMSLQDTDEVSVTAFKEKLDKVRGMLGEKKVEPNNPAPAANTSTPSREEMADILHDPNKFHDYVTTKFPGIAAMTRQDTRK